MSKPRLIGIGFFLLAVGIALGKGNEEAAARKGSGATTKAAVEIKQDENPIGQEGKWINGKKEGLDWADVCVKGGMAFGTEGGKVKYDDSTALLKGTWGADQEAEAKVHTVNQKSDNVYEEVELRLRSKIEKHLCTGYEVNFRCVGHDHGYNQIVRWNGKLGDFKILAEGEGGGVADGDVIKATIVGNVIT